MNRQDKLVILCYVIVVIYIGEERKTILEINAMDQNMCNFCAISVSIYVQLPINLYLVPSLHLATGNRLYVELTYYTE